MPSPRRPFTPELILFGDDALIDHARRMWDAEAENASRLSHRVNLSLTVIAALFGLGLFKIEWYRRDTDVFRLSDTRIEWSVKVLILIGVTLLGVALYRLLVRPSPRPDETDHASVGLMLPKEYLDAPGSSQRYMRKVIFTRTYLAACDLRERNEQEGRRIRAAQQLLFAALGSLILATMIFTTAAG